MLLKAFYQSVSKTCNSVKWKWSNYARQVAKLAMFVTSSHASSSIVQPAAAPGAARGAVEGQRRPPCYGAPVRRLPMSSEPPTRTQRATTRHPFVRTSQSRTRGHTTKIILWGSHSSIVISRRHTGEATTNTTSQTSTLVGANLCLLIPKPKSLATATFHNAPFDSSKQRRPKELSMRAKHRERGGSPGPWRRGLATCQAFVSPQRGALPTLRMNRFS